MKFDPLALRPFKSVLIVIGALLVSGILLRPIEDPAWREMKANEPALQLDSVQGALGQGVTVGLLGGFRALAADLFWIKTNDVWEKYDLPATQTLIRLVTAIDPRPLYFWLNGSRVIAYDMPNWRIKEEGGYDAVPKERQDEIDHEQSRRALLYLDDAFRYHPNEAMLEIEKANIYLNRLKDTPSAAEAYKRASGMNHAPAYAPRIYAELLRRMDRNQEAYDWLKKLYPTLPKLTPEEQEKLAQSRSAADQRKLFQIEAAMADVVMDRIRELEETLHIPAEQRFQ